MLESHQLFFHPFLGGPFPAVPRNYWIRCLNMQRDVQRMRCFEVWVLPPSILLVFKKEWCAPKKCCLEHLSNMWSLKEVEVSPQNELAMRRCSLIPYKSKLGPLTFQYGTNTLNTPPHMCRTFKPNMWTTHIVWLGSTCGRWIQHVQPYSDTMKKFDVPPQNQLTIRECNPTPYKPILNWVLQPTSCHRSFNWNEGVVCE